MSTLTKSKSILIKDQVRKTLRIIIRIPLFIISNIKNLFLKNKKYQFDDELSICAIVKNEGEYIEEWIIHHINIGCTKFYIYDNDSSDNTYNVLKPYIEKGYVDYEQIHGKNRHYDAYNSGLKKAKYKSKYMAFIDVDEFLMPCDKRKHLVQIIDEIFNSDNKIGGLGVNWRMYGSSGFDTKPSGLVLSNFLYRAEDINGRGNDCIKSIVNPRKVFRFFSSHYPIFLIGYYEVNEDCNKCNKAYSKSKKLCKIRLNHYFTKSKEEWIKRRKNGKSDTHYVKENFRTIEEFYEHDNNDVYDDIGLYYGDLVIQKMK